MQNFWENSGWEKHDPHLKRIAEMPFQRDFPFIPAKKGLYILRGLRQIGKSSWLKKILSHYCSKDEAKWADDARNLSKAYLNLNLLDKKVWTKRNFLL